MRIAFFPHKCAGTHSLSSVLWCCLGAEPSCSLPVTHHCHPSPSPITITRHQTRCHPCRTRRYLPLNHCCLLRGPKPCICCRRRRYPNLSLPPCQTSP